jgi:hypothetical protein
MHAAKVMRMLAMALIALGAVGCGSNVKGKIEDTRWSNNEYTGKDGKKIPANMLKLDFRADGSMTFSVMGIATNGKYTLGTGSSVTFEMDKVIAGGSKKMRNKIAIDGETMTITDSDGAVMTLRKVT